MTKSFFPIAPQHFREFFQIFQGDPSTDPCLSCDRLCESSRQVTTAFLLPGELEFLHEFGVHPEHLLDPISTAHGLMYCWSPAATCTYLQNDRCQLGKDPHIKPVECAIYPLIF
ncbi:MAG TPA: hypothetical protein DD789_09000, partial [Firmicutes bacterium]|nr:hypothetical protein [Bacillota bacterium]